MKVNPLQKFLVTKAKTEKRKLMDVKREFAGRVGISYGFLDQIINGNERPEWPSTVNRIIAETGGKVTTKDLRPDIVKEVLKSPDLVRELIRSKKVANG